MRRVIEDIQSWLIDQNGKKELYLLSRDKDQYTGFFPIVEQARLDELSDLIQNNLEQYKDCKVEEYDPTVTKVDSIEKFRTEDIPGLDDLYNSIENCNGVNSNLSVDNFNFYVLSIKENTDSDTIYIIRRTTYFNTINKNGIFFSRNRDGSGGFRIENDIKFGLDSRIDLIIKGQECFIFNHSSFESIFDLKNMFDTKSSEFLDHVKSIDLIDGYEAFEEACKGNLNHMKRLTKLLSRENNEEILRTIKDNVNNIEKVIDSFEVSFKVRDSKIVYEDDSKVHDIINVLSDAYYESIIAERKGIVGG